MRQTTLLDFLKVNYITFIFIPIKKVYRSRRGLSERQLRKRLEKQSWTVWRGNLINIIRDKGIYPNIKRKYSLLCTLLEKYHPGKLEYLQYLCEVHHGLPDFICFRNGVFKFVECKLGYESLSKQQKRCIPKLQALGFSVEVHKLVEQCTKTRLAIVNLSTGQKNIKERQMMLKARAFKS